MAYSMVSPSRYPFSRENAKFFCQELIEYVLHHFGHIWKPERSNQEIRLRKVSMFAFLPSIGRLVAYISQKYSGFVFIKAYKTWKYVNSHRPSVKERLLCNEIATLCSRHELDDDDLGLFTFLAIVSEYARLVVISEQKYLIDAIVDSSSYCLTTILSDGFVPTLNRLIRRASNFEYPRNYVICDYDPQTKFIFPVSTAPMSIPSEDFVSPIGLEFHFPASLHRTPPEDIMTQLKIRKVHRELFRRTMMTDKATQTEVQTENSASQLRCVIFRNTYADLLEKMNIKDEDSDSRVLDATFTIVVASDASVQTWTSGEQFAKLHAETDETEKTGAMSKSSSYAKRHSLDLNVIIEKLKNLERVQVKDSKAEKAQSDVSEINIQKPEDRKHENTNLKSSLSAKSAISKESVEGETENTDTVLQFSKIKWLSRKDSDTGASSDGRQFQSYGERADDPTKFENEQNLEKDDSCDSQVEKLDESITTPDNTLEH